MSLIILKSFFWGMEGASVLGWGRWHLSFCLLWLSIQCTRGAWSSQGYHHQLCFRNGSDTIRHSIFFFTVCDPIFEKLFRIPHQEKSNYVTPPAYSHTTVLLVSSLTFLRLIVAGVKSLSCERLEWRLQALECVWALLDAHQLMTALSKLLNVLLECTSF